tara:strand:- start:1220 stop:1705 length:486 start_codon:yes stop_codon:yes gene_type:complete
MTAIVAVLPNYEPKIDEKQFIKVDLNIRDLQEKFPNGCICCNNKYYPAKYSSLISKHFNTKKHKKLCLDVENESFKNDFGNSKDILDAFNNKCKENRELKKLNYEYKDEIFQFKNKIEKLENKIEKLENKNNTLQTINLGYQQKSLLFNGRSVNTTNLIDL